MRERAFRATTITAELRNGGHGTAQQIPRHESPGITELHRRKEEISLDEVEGMVI